MAKLRNFILRYTSISAVIDVLRRRQLPLLNPNTWDDRNDRHFMALYKEKKEIGGLYGLCAATCSETYHHWRVFTGSSDGACIEIRRQPLEDALRPLTGVRFGNVKYLYLDDVEKLTTADLDRLPFVKRVGFTAEEEYRIIAKTQESQAGAISIDLPLEFISKIYLNPWLPKSLAQSVTLTLRSLDGCGKLKIQRSHLIDNDRWKKAGDLVAGKAETTDIEVLKTQP